MAPTSGSSRALLSVLLAPLIPQVIGSLFNIIYNLMMILPLLEPMVVRGSGDGLRDGAGRSGCAARALVGLQGREVLA